jgi:hypothetical protein
MGLIYDRSQERRPFSLIWLEQEIPVIDDLVTADPKLLSPIKGGGAERIYEVHVLSKTPEVSHFQKLNEKKCPDYVIRYLEYSDLIVCEVKCLASRTIKVLKDGTLEAKVNISHRDPRQVDFPCGGSANLLNIHKGEYDLLAINLFDLLGEHRWAYINAEDLEIETKFPKSACYADLTEEQKASGFLLKNHQTVNWPLKAPWTMDFPAVLHSVMETKRGREAA